MCFYFVQSNFETFDETFCIFIKYFLMLVTLPLTSFLPSTKKKQKRYHPKQQFQDLFQRNK